MAKKKQQKRGKEDPILNALKKYMGSSHMSDHDFIVMIKRSAAGAREAFHLSKSVRDPIRLPENQKDIRYSLALGMAIAEFWANRTVFRISKESYQKILDVFPAEYCNINSTVYEHALLEHPIVVQVMDKGLPVVSLFEFSAGFSLDTANPWNGSCIAEYNLLSQNSSQWHQIDNSISFLMTEDMPQKKDMIKLHTFLGYYSRLAGSKGKVFVEDLKQPGVYEVSLPEPELIPAWDTPIGALSVGLSQTWGWYSPALMHDFLNEKIDTSISVNDILPPLYGDEKPEEKTEDMLRNIIYQHYLHWDQNRVVYQYTTEVAIACYKKYRTCLNPVIDVNLFSYIPSKCMVLSNAENGNAYTLILYKQMGSNTQVVPGLYVYCQGYEGTGICNLTFLSDQTVINTAEGEDFASRGMQQDYVSEVLPILYHILVTMKSKQEKAQSKTPTNSNTVPAAHSKNVDNAKSEEPGEFREGYSLPVNYTRVYDVTERTVRKTKHKEFVSRTGWHMCPHVRRGHTHRFWVGTGENRHLEARQLGEIRVNCHDADPQAVVHVIK